eukprot:scaffold20609_cov20-Tisochrysis_lutea.AAC.1
MYNLYIELNLNNSLVNQEPRFSHPAMYARMQHLRHEGGQLSTNEFDASNYSDTVQVSKQ